VHLTNTQGAARAWERILVVAGVTSTDPDLAACIPPPLAGPAAPAATTAAGPSAAAPVSLAPLTELLAASEVEKLLTELRDRRYKQGGATSLGSALNLPRDPLLAAAFVSALTAVAQGLEEFVSAWGTTHLPKLAARRSLVWKQAQQPKRLSMLEKAQKMKERTYLQHWWVTVEPAQLPFGIQLTPES
jgi:hypothetical protein